MSILLKNSNISTHTVDLLKYPVSLSQRLTAGSVKDEAKFNSNTNKQLS